MKLLAGGGGVIVCIDIVFICLYSSLFDSREHSAIFSFFPHMKPSQLRPILRESKVCVMPTKCFETFGLSIVEATLAGCIPLVRDIGALNETAEKYAGLVFSDSKASYLLCSVLENYESIFNDFKLKREQILQNLHNGEYLKNLIKVYETSSGGGA